MKANPATVAGLWVALCLAVNGFIFAAGWNDDATLPLQPAWKPAGWVIGMVWLGLFACMGLAHGLLVKTGDGLQGGLVALLAACLAYPFYTGGLQSGPVAYYGTVATLAGTLMLMGAAHRYPFVRWLLLPVVVWLCFAAALIQATLRLNGLA